ncbi:MAG: hypothetical protein ACC655_07860 [Rhodothermia bacterium]
MLRSFSVVFALVSAVILLPASNATAQTPNLYWMQHSLDANSSECVDTAIEGLTAGTMYDLTTGTKADSGSRFATGSNSNLNAVIACHGSEKTVATVIVAGSADHIKDANILGAYLSQFMLGERDGAPDLSSSEAPVKMHEWLTDEWCLGCEGSETEKRYSGDIQKPARSIRVRVLSGRPESGDGSVEVLVYDPSGRLVLAEESSHDDWAEWRVGVINYGRYEIVLRNHGVNTDSAGPNKGEIQVLVR